MKAQSGIVLAINYSKINQVNLKNWKAYTTVTFGWSCIGRKLKRLKRCLLGAEIVSLLTSELLANTSFQAENYAMNRVVHTA